MGKQDTQPPSYGEATRNARRKKTSEHRASHLKKRRRQERANERLRRSGMSVSTVQDSGKDA